MLNVETLLLINKAVDGPGIVLNQSLLKSITSSYEYYNTLEEQGTSVFRSIIKNHAFVDGNKRTAVAFLYGFADVHKLRIRLNETEMFNLILKVATSSIEVEQLSKKIFW